MVTVLLFAVPADWFASVMKDMQVRLAIDALQDIKIAAAFAPSSIVCMEHLNAREQHGHANVIRVIRGQAVMNAIRKAGVIISEMAALRLWIVTDMELLTEKSVYAIHVI